MHCRPLDRRAVLLGVALLVAPLTLGQCPGSLTGTTIDESIRKSTPVKRTNSVTPDAKSTTSATPMDEPSSISAIAVPIARLEGDCYTDLTVLHDDVSRKSPFEVATYILCPNTVFTIGFVDPDSIDFTYKNGSWPLLLRRKTHYLCGTEGRASNNCTLLGGTSQASNAAFYFGNEDSVDVLVQGVTFQSATHVGAHLTSGGDVAFVDCIFQYHENVGAVIMAYYPPNEDRTRRRETMYSALRDLSSRTQSDLAPTRLSVTFDSCLFQGNSHGTESAMSLFSVIHAMTEFNTLTVQGCLFLENTFDVNHIVGDSSAINVVTGSTLVVTDSCFIRNTFVGRGTIVVDDPNDLVAHHGNFGVTNGVVTCPFVRMGGTESPTDCVDYGSTTCRSTWFDESMLVSTETYTPSASSNHAGVRVWIVVGSIVALIGLNPLWYP